MNHRVGWQARRTLLAAALFITYGLNAPPAATQDTAAAPGTAQEALAAGTLAYGQGRFENALLHFDESLQRAGDRDEEGVIADALARRAETYKALGFHLKAIGDLASALGLAQEQGDLRRQAALHGILGDTLRRVGEPKKAEEQLELCVSLARQSGEQRTLAIAMNDLATLMMTSGRDGEALAAYEASIALAEQAGDAGLAAKATINTARARLDGGDPVGAANLLEDAMSTLAPQPAGHEKAYALIAVGSLLREIPDDATPLGGKRLRLAYRAFDQALGIAEDIGDLRAQSYALGFMGRLYEAAGRYQEAGHLTRRALFAAESLDAAELSYLWHWQRGRLLRAEGDLDRAIEAYRHSVSDLQSIRSDFLVGFRGGRSPFRKAVEPVFLQLADLQLRTAAEAGDGETGVRLIAVRETIEQLKAAELQDYFQDECVAELQAKIKPIDQLEDQTAAIYPIMLSDRLELLVSLPSGLRQVTVEVSAESLTAQIRSYRNFLEKRTTRQYLRPAQRLYDWLIRPIEAQLKAEQIDTLIFVPDGPMRTVPMAPLHDGKQHLIAQYAVAVTPGLGLLDPKPSVQAGVSALLSGLTEAKPGFPALLNVAGEISRAKEIFGGGTVLMDSSFLLGNFQQKLSDQPFSLVHIASHGQFKSEADESFLLAYDGKLTLDGLERVVKQSRFREEPVELLTLSACQTAAGDDRAALGLAGVAVKAGARSALASLWFINDQASSDLVSEFYRELSQPGSTKAKALQKAQLAMLSDPRYQHPGYWSPFLLIGNWL